MVVLKERERDVLNGCCGFTMGYWILESVEA